MRKENRITGSRAEFYELKRKRQYGRKHCKKGVDEMEITETKYGNEIHLPITTIDKIVSEKLEEMNKAEDIGEAKDILREITEIVRVCLEQETVLANGDQCHNFAVDIARYELYDLACDILEKGLARENFPKDTDLLADYLKYGSACGRKDRCKEIYKILSKIPKIRYTWRAFSFSIDWLQHLWKQSDSEKEMEKLQKEMFGLAEAFHNYIPDTEESYCCLADIYKMLHKKVEEEKVLRQALHEIEIAPKSALRMADILFARGEYEEAMVFIERGIDSAETRSTVNIGYLYYLRGLGKNAIIIQQGKNWTQQVVQEIYSDFDMALDMAGRVLDKEIIESRTKAMSRESGIPVTDEYEELIYLIG